MLARTSRLAAAIALVAAPMLVHAQKPGKLTWGPAPAVFPAGARMAVVDGDPSKSGPFTLQLSMPKGYVIAPHFHPTEENVTVKKGIFLVGMGDKLDTKAMKRMTKGQSGKIDANMHHYAMAKGKTVVEDRSTGPFVLTYVNPADDPSKMKP